MQSVTPVKDRKRVGLTPTLYPHPSYDEVRETLDVRWARLMRSAGLFPVTLSTDYTVDDVARLELDGVLFTGGNDLASLNDCALSRQRDSFELSILEYCFSNELPVLGVCRGFQLLLHVSGVKLEKISNHVATRHALEYSDKTFPLEAQAGDVNSYHNYAARSIGDEWSVLAKSLDGSIEAAYWEARRALGIMWHPERELPFRLHDINTIHQFFTK